MKYAILTAVLVTILMFAHSGRSAYAQQRRLTRDQIHIAVQEICPVSGQKLGAHGPPVKARIGEEHLFLCCEECLRRDVKPQHWATVHANFARAQRICPVMENPIPKKAAWTIVEGQIVYVCCPPCTDDIEADPETFLRKIDELYAASLRSDGASR